MFDHALTRPWSVDKTYIRNPNPYPNFSRVTCMENTHQLVYRQGELLPERRRPVDAGQEGSGAARSEIFKQTQK